ncbi:MAG: DUF3144 domain-containing protein [Nitrospira sp.]|nr:DUF3144 domain-containing protein [Nitrospira sp.]
MAIDVDDNFYDRADAHINLSNDQLKEIGSGKVSASMMFALARFNSWVSAGGFSSSDEMKEKREEIVEYFPGQYRNMFEDNLDDYIANFEKYMGSGNYTA